MNIHGQRLTLVIHQHGLLAGVVCASDGSQLSEVGDPRAGQLSDLHSALLGPRGDSKETFDSLTQQILPQIWSQGDSFAIVDKPTNAEMVVVFGQGGDGVGQYLISKSVSASIREQWSESSLP